MAIYQSAAYMGDANFRTLGDQPAEITATIEIPANTRLTTADKLLFLHIGEAHSIDEVVVRFEALDNAQTPTLTLNVGYETVIAADDPDAFLAASTLGRAGGQAQVENGGNPAFAVGALAPINEILDLVAIPAANAASAAGTGTLGTGISAKSVTLTAKISRKTSGLQGTPYRYGA
jgi:hypothetical protein